MRQAILLSFVAVAATVSLRAAAADAKPARMWNPETVTTVTGTVEAVERIEMGADWKCVRVRLRTDAGTLVVRNDGRERTLEVRLFRMDPKHPVRK